VRKKKVEAPFGMLEQSEELAYSAAKTIKTE